MLYWNLVYSCSTIKSSSSSKLGIAEPFLTELEVACLNLVWPVGDLYCFSNTFRMLVETKIFTTLVQRTGKLSLLLVHWWLFRLPKTELAITKSQCDERELRLGPPAWEGASLFAKGDNTQWLSIHPLQIKLTFVETGVPPITKLLFFFQVIWSHSTIYVHSMLRKYSFDVKKWCSL
jgi:hypothetical protein